MTTIYLIRHAEAEGNVFRRLHGQYDSMVTPNGRRQIAALARRFADIPIQAVYASDLTRTCITASAVYRPKGLPLRRDARFREVGVGIWEDLPFGWLEHTQPEKNYAFSHDPQHWSVEGSEPFETYTGRFLQALEEVACRHEGQSVAIFSHGMVLRGVQQRLFFQNVGELPHGENTCVTTLHWENGSYSLCGMNDADHLTPEISTLGRQQWWRGDGKKDFNMWFRDAQPCDAELLGALGCPVGAQVRVSMLSDHATGAIALNAEGDLLWLALLPEARGVGLSAQLLGEAVSLGRRVGKTELRLCTAPEHPAARRLLENYGFESGACSLLVRAD